MTVMRAPVRFVVLAAICSAILAGASPAFAADLVVQSVNTSEFPSVEIRVALPPEMVIDGAVPLFEVSENGVDRTVTSADPESSFARQSIDVVLLLDASGSMAGKPLAAAKAAAREFVASLGASDRIAVVTIGEDPKVVTSFTADRAELERAISSVKAQGETALYDSVVRATELFGESEAQQRYLVLLSDGGDTVSAASLDKAIDRVKDVGAPVYAVALSSPEYNPRAVKALARSTRGTLLSTREADKLTGIFKAIAEEIQTTWLVSYRSADPPSPDLEIILTAASGSTRGQATAVADNPTFEATKNLPWNVVRLDPAFTYAAWGIAVVAGLAVGFAAMGTGLLLRREGTAIDQLAYYDQLRATDTKGSGEAEGDPNSIRSRLDGAVRQVAGSRGITADLKDRLDRAGYQLRPNEFMYLHLLGVAVVGVIVQLALHMPLLTVLAVVLATWLPFSYLEWAANRRTARFESDLPDIVSLIAGSLRSGWGIQQALDLIVDETREPASSEFRRVQSETRLGLSLEESLNKMAARLNSVDFTWIVTAIGIQREVGGNLAEVLDIAAGAIRERAELRREVVALTAEGRFSAIILVALPFVMFGGLFFVGPRYIGQMTSSVYGWMMLGLAGFLLLIGAIWLFRVSKVEV